MKKHWMIGVCLCLLPMLGVAEVKLSELDRDMTGPRSQLLVLGTVHLNELKDGYPPQALDALLNRLAAYRPQIITVEALPGQECDVAERFSAEYGDDYCASTERARAATGLDIPAAAAEIRRALGAWPQQPLPAQRRQLAAWFLAVNDRASALVQWLQLADSERRVGDGLDSALVDLLIKAESSRNEHYQLAARLAARLGLERVYPVDNHTGDNVQVADRAAFGEAISAAWQEGAGELAELFQREDELAHADDLLPLYRFINEPRYLRALAEVNVHAALQAKAAENYPQMWVAGWETRNLRMVANIRETFRERPGARVLIVVGASHKPWFDSWLGQLQGIDIVDAEQVLK